MTEYLLVPFSFLASSLAGVVGMGGGILLITLMPGLIPTAAIIPLHAVTQLASNFSRAGFGWRHIEWRLVPSIALGAVAGAALGAGIYSRLSLDWLPALIGVLILLLTWVPLPAPRGRGRLSLLLLGFYQAGLGMIAGATGPLGAAVLARYGEQRDWLVVNTAVYMSLSHVVRAAAFGLLGFQFAPWLPLLFGMIVASVAGSWVGTRLRQYVPQANFQRWFRILISVLALRMIMVVVLAQ